MFPIVTCGDIHCSGKNPPERLDDLSSNQWKKIDNIVEIANNHNAPVVFTGDLFNSPLVANRIISMMGHRLSQLKERFYFVFGNHDLLYHNLDMLEQTSMGVIWMNNPKVRHISQFEEDYGRAWSYIDWRSDFIDPKARYLLAHRAIVNDNLITANSWILEDRDFCEHVKNLGQYDLIVCGHWHKQYEYHYQHAPNHSTHVLNPGVICRRSIVEREQPSVWIIDLDNPQDHATRVDLNAPHANEVLREESLKSSITPHAAEITRFIEQLKSDSLSQRVSFIQNLMSIVDQLGNEKALDREIRDIIATVQARKEKHQL